MDDELIPVEAHEDGTFSFCVSCNIDDLLKLAGMRQILPDDDDYEDEYNGTMTFVDASPDIRG